MLMETTTPATLAQEDTATEQRPTLQELAAQLARVRQQPCLLFIVPHIGRDCLNGLLDAVKGASNKRLDVVLHSDGGDIHAAYLAAREMKRRFKHVTMFVPVRAKSAAMMLCVIAEELVLGRLGELGPLDGQYQSPELGDPPADCSGLVPFTALEQLNETAGMMYESLLDRFIKSVHMKAADACSQAAHLVSELLRPLYAQISPTVLAENARRLDLGSQHALRLLVRYHPDRPEAARREMVDRLVHAYPCHCFPLDYEELKELGFPVRRPTATEESIIETLAISLSEPDSEQLITLVNHDNDGHA